MTKTIDKKSLSTFDGGQPLQEYDNGGFYCEIFGRETPPAHTRKIRNRLAKIDLKGLRRRARAAEQELFNLGITFTVYSDRDVIDRILPFDVIPRIISKKEWLIVDKGLKQRVAALNLFLKDVYHDQKILKDKIIPSDLVLDNEHYCKEMVGVRVPNDTYVHICGTDIVRNENGEFLVLEDNCRTPSGVSYVIENRHLMMRAFPDLAEDIAIADVDEYGSRLMRTMQDVAPKGADDPTIVLLSPGTYNSAYFEHVFLAREMGAVLVEAQDLVVEKDKVYMHTTGGLEPVHVIYRRVSDEFMDPTVFRPDSLLGVPGIFDAYRKGNVTLANAMGTGVADDKAVYAYMPRIIDYYLGEEPILKNVPTHICREEEGLDYTLDHIEELVVKPVGESGGYGVVVGPKSTKKALSQLRKELVKNPANYISQPVVNLSVSPTLTGRSIEARHVDIRPFALTGKSTWVLPGGLTRVALRRGSLIVNSSQGGGSKDTWILA